MSAGNDTTPRGWLRMNGISQQTDTNGLKACKMVIREGEQQALHVDCATVQSSDCANVQSTDYSAHPGCR